MRRLIIDFVVFVSVLCVIVFFAMRTDVSPGAARASLIMGRATFTIGRWVAYIAFAAFVGLIEHLVLDAIYDAEPRWKRDR